MPDARIWYIRSEQVFGLLSVIYLYFALILSPLSKVVGKRDWVPALLFARRAIGVSAAYFAALHVAISTWGQLGGIQGLWDVPPVFRVAVLLGLLALIILLLLAVTSVDRIIALIGLKRWIWLHRFIYLAGLVIIVHVYMIGTHVGAAYVQGITLGMLAVLFGLESIRITRFVHRGWNFRRVEAIIIGVLFWVFLTGGLLAVRTLVPSYSKLHNHGPVGGGTHAH